MYGLGDKAKEAFGQLLLDRLLGALHGDRFVSRVSAARRTVGDGIVVDPWPRDPGRWRPDRLASRGMSVAADPKKALLVSLPGDPGGADMDRFALRRWYPSARGAMAKAVGSRGWSGGG